MLINEDLKQNIKEKINKNQNKLLSYFKKEIPKYFRNKYVEYNNKFVKEKYNEIYTYLVNKKK